MSNTLFTQYAQVNWCQAEELDNTQAIGAIGGITHHALAPSPLAHQTYFCVCADRISTRTHTDE